MKRIFIIVLDSFGIGSAPDAYKFGDTGANTLGNIAKACASGKVNKMRRGKLYLPNLSALGLGKATEESSGIFPIGLDAQANIIGAYAYASQLSSGKDTSSGHWEIAGVPVLFEWGYFKDKKNSFPKKLLDKLIHTANLSGYLGNCHASGTKILDELGEEHINTKKPIFYTSIDSVFQIACHEKFFGLNQLYKICSITRKILNDDKYNIARVIARPFIGSKKGYFQRTNNRRDYSMKPHKKTILKKLIEEKSGTVIAIGKIADIYANVGITKNIQAYGINNLFNISIQEIKKSTNNTIVFTNFVDFDSLYGHRRDVAGYAAELELFDSRLPEILQLIKENDILIITADHGCDPTWSGFDHTRENIPILIYGPNIKPGTLGYSNTFADIAQSIASYFGLSQMEYGKILF
uniref:Phosphopentomutase n=1 Tax=Candidatus Aschnera chinzeii TaxID=1485666 RepID=A0AAT9G4V0_9ENTR|nr:MAG: phosphopentomutase [Candidatus Aschnera chinzeii]